MNRQMHKRLLAILLSCMLCLPLLILPTHAAKEPSPAGYPTVPVYYNGSDTGAVAYVLEDGVTYMTLRSASAILFPDAEIGWNSQTGEATLHTADLSLSAVWGEPYICANGRYFALSAFEPAENRLVDGVTYVPLRLLAKAADASIDWNAADRRVEISGGTGTVTPGDRYYRDDDVYWLSRILYAEAGNQSLRGQLAVGAVIMNRLADPAYPDSLYDVIFDRRFGVQFTPTANGTIYQTPSAQCVIAAKLILDGCRISEEALYFLDPTIATSLWVVRNCRALFTIGDHDFYA